jgi:hypothetical protein
MGMMKHWYKIPGGAIRWETTKGTRTGEGHGRRICYGVVFLVILKPCDIIAGRAGLSEALEAAEP